MSALTASRATARWSAGAGLKGVLVHTCVSHGRGAFFSPETLRLRPLSSAVPGCCSSPLSFANAEAIYWARRCDIWYVAAPLPPREPLGAVVAWSLVLQRMFCAVPLTVPCVCLACLCFCSFPVAGKGLILGFFFERGEKRNPSEKLNCPSLRACYQGDLVCSVLFFYFFFPASHGFSRGLGFAAIWTLAIQAFKKKAHKEF